MPPKRRRSESESVSGSTGRNSRRDAQKRVAFERASHFARADRSDRSDRSKRSAASSTPTGVVNLPDDTQNESEYSWPGPFSTAHDMMSKREAARAAREKAISDRERSEDDPSKLPQFEDDYERMLYELQSNPPALSTALNSSNCIVNSKIARLSSLCLRVIAENFERVESIGPQPVEVRQELALELARHCKLTPAALRILTAQETTDDESEGAGITELILPDCSIIDEDALVESLCSASRSSSLDKDVAIARTESSLEVLELRHCGHALTPWAVSTLVSRGVLNNIHVLTLTGAYRLTDSHFKALLDGICSTHSCGDGSAAGRRGKRNLSKVSPVKTSSLRALDLSFSSHLGDTTISSLCQSAPLLTRLVLDYTALEREALETLSANQMSIPCLVELSLAGLEALSDDLLADLLSGLKASSSVVSSSVVPIGKRLHHLSVRECHNLTDQGLVAIRTYCSTLQSIDLSSVRSFTSVAMLGLFVEEESYYAPTEFLNDQSKKSSQDVSVCSSAAPALHSLILDDLADAVTDDVVIQACKLSASAGGKGIQVLSISGCGKVSSKSIMALKYHCSTTLRELNISFVRCVSALALHCLVSAACKLEKLTIWGCTQLQIGRGNKSESCVNIFDIQRARLGMKIHGYM